MKDDKWASARLQDQKKAHSRVNKPALWLLLERYGLKCRCLVTVMDKHKTKK